MLNFINGKKTYIVAGLTFIAGGLMACGVNIPDYVWIILSAAGLGAVRDALPKKA